MSIPIAPATCTASASQRAISFISRNRGEILFTIGTLMTPVVSLVGGVVMVKCLHPYETGVLTTATLLPAYLSFLHCGIFTGMARNLPFYRGAGDEAKAKRILWTSAATATWVGLAGFTVCLILAARSYFFGHNQLLSAAFVATAITVLISPITQHIDIALRGYQKFRRLAGALIWTNSTNLVLTSLIIWLGSTGAVLRLAIAALSSMLCRLGTGLWSGKMHMELDESFELVKVGVPLLLSGTFFSFLMVADRSLVAITLGPEAMGQFALAGMIVASMQFVPQSVSMVLFPRIAKLYGQTKSSRALRRYVWISLGLNVVSIVPLSLLCYFIIQPLVMHFFPAYQEGIGAAKIACLTCVCWVYLGVGSVIGVTNRMFPYLIMMGFMLIIIWVLGWWLIRSGCGIEGAAWARFIGTFGLCLFTIGYAFYLTSREFAPRD